MGRDYEVMAERLIADVPKEHLLALVTICDALKAYKRLETAAKLFRDFYYVNYEEQWDVVGYHAVDEALKELENV